MNAQHVGLFAGILTLAGCASTEMTRKDTLNEPSERLANLEDRRPPNPNRPNDSRELKSVPVIIQHDPALNKPHDDAREEKRLTVNPGGDQLVRPQSPTRVEGAPNTEAGAAAAAQSATVSKSDNELATKVKDAIRNFRDPGANRQTLASESTSGEAKALENLEVNSKNGQVTISGSVSSETERTAIEQAATRVPGVVSVANYVTIAKSEKQ